MMNESKPSSSPIQTILSALEFHQILPKKLDSRAKRIILITAGREFHPAPKMNDIFNLHFYYIHHFLFCKEKNLTEYEVKFAMYVFI